MFVQNISRLSISAPRPNNKQVSFGDVNTMPVDELLTRAKHLVSGNKARLSERQWDKLAHAVAVIQFSKDPLPPAQYIQEKPDAVAILRKFVRKYAKVK